MLLLEGSNFAVDPVIAASRYGDAGVCVAIGALAVELGCGILIRSENRVTGEWNEVN